MVSGFPLVLAYGFFALASLGTLFSGIAALIALRQRNRVKAIHENTALLPEIRREVNGQTDTLVATAHKLGVQEGIVAERDAQANGGAHA